VFILVKNLQTIWYLTNEWQFKNEAIVWTTSVSCGFHLQCLTIQVTRGIQTLQSGKGGGVEKNASCSPTKFLNCSKHPLNSLSSFCCSLLVQNVVLQHLDASFTGSKPLSVFRNQCDPLFRVRLRFLCFFKDGLPTNVKKTVEREILNVWVYKIQEIIGIVYMN